MDTIEDPCPITRAVYWIYSVFRYGISAFRVQCPDTYCTAANYIGQV